MGGDGAAALAQQLESNEGILDVDVANNALASKGARGFAKLLQARAPPCDTSPLERVKAQSDSPYMKFSARTYGEFDFDFDVDSFEWVCSQHSVRVFARHRVAPALALSFFNSLGFNLLDRCQTSSSILVEITTSFK